jgi:hypothetical protein
LNAPSDSRDLTYRGEYEPRPWRPVAKPELNKIRGPNKQDELGKQPCTDPKVIDGYDVRIDKGENQECGRHKDPFRDEKGFAQVVTVPVELQPHESSDEEKAQFHSIVQREKQEVA